MIPRRCKFDECLGVCEVVPTPDKPPHVAKYECGICRRFNDWVKASDFVRFTSPLYRDHPDYPESGDQLYSAFPDEGDAFAFRQLCRSLGINWPQALDTIALYGCKTYEGALDILTGGSDRRTQLGEKAMNVTFEGTSTIWRIADGALCRGRGRGGEESIPMIVGKLTRIGHHVGQADDGETYEQVECDLETEDGNVSVKAAIKHGVASNVTPFMFVQGLLATRKGDLIAIKPSKSQTAHEKYGTFTTFVNVGVVDPSTMRAKAVSVPKEEFDGASSKEKLPNALERLKSHPAYAARPSKDEPADDGFALSPEREPMLKLKAVVVNRSWPDIETYEAEYVALAKKALKGGSFISLSELTDDQLEMIAKSIQGAKSIPEPLATIAADAYDPFADN